MKRILQDKSKFPSSLLFTYKTCDINSILFFFHLITSSYRLLDMCLTHNLLFKAGPNFFRFGGDHFSKTSPTRMRNTTYGDGLVWAQPLSLDKDSLLVLCFHSYQWSEKDILKSSHSSSL